MTSFNFIKYYLSFVFIQSVLFICIGFSLFYALSIEHESQKCYDAELSRHDCLDSKMLIFGQNFNGTITNIKHVNNFEEFNRDVCNIWSDRDTDAIELRILSRNDAPDNTLKLSELLKSNLALVIMELLLSMFNMIWGMAFWYSYNNSIRDIVNQYIVMNDIVIAN